MRGREEWREGGQGRQRDGEGGEGRGKDMRRQHGKRTTLEEKARHLRNMHVKTSSI